jgi:hypothetical protein
MTDKELEDYEVEEIAVSWLLAVRKYGLEIANAMFPEG